MVSASVSNIAKTSRRCWRGMIGYSNSGYSLLLKTCNGILHFLSFHWFTGHGIRAHIPWTTNMCTHQLRTVGELKYCNSLGVFFFLTIIPLALVGYEIVIVNLVLRASLTIYHLHSPPSNSHVKTVVADRNK